MSLKIEIKLQFLNSDPPHTQPAELAHHPFVGGVTGAWEREICFWGIFDLNFKCTFKTFLSHWNIKLFSKKNNQTLSD